MNGSLRAMKKVYVFMCLFLLWYLPLFLPAQGVSQEAPQENALATDGTSATAPSVSPPWTDYPVIPNLSKVADTFKQFLIEVQENKRRWVQGKSLLPISLYVYQIKKQDSIFTISAKASISVESIATLNRLEHSSGLPHRGSYILLPNNSGIFLPQDESRGGTEQRPYQSLSAWEQQLLFNRAEILFHRLVVRGRVYFYYPKSQFNQKERQYFLRNSVRSPVQQRFHITSPFGSRRDPVSGKSSHHDGLDIRSPYGAPIYSIANGTVVDLGESKLYGLFVKIRLDPSSDSSLGNYLGNSLNNGLAHNGRQVLYGHLTAVLVAKGQRVHAGEAIGNSGQSGRSTGPHLHLSIFQNGKAIDPAPLFQNLY